MMRCLALAVGAVWLTLAAADTECPAAPSTPEDRRSDKNTLRVVQFNAEWLFIDQTSGNIPCPGECTWANETEAEKHLEAIAQVVADLNPDILNFCEIEGCDELNDVIAQLGDSYGYNPYLIKGEDTYTQQNVGMLTRIDPTMDVTRTDDRVDYPLEGQQCGYPGSTGSGGSYGCTKHSLTTFNINGMDVVFVAVHFLSNPTDEYACAKREAQATVVRNFLQPYLDKGYEAIVLGDMNDFDADVLDSNGDVPNSRALSILKGDDLTNAYVNLDQSERYTEWYDENEDCVFSLSEVSAIDHVLLSKGLLDKVTSVSVAHPEYDQSCTDYYYSDHWPVVVDFDLS